MANQEFNQFSITKPLGLHNLISCVRKACFIESINPVDDNEVRIFCPTLGVSMGKRGALGPIYQSRGRINERTTIGLVYLSSPN